jgi:hypothetical protein
MNDEVNTREKLERFRNDIQKRVKDRIGRQSTLDSLQDRNKEQAEKKAPLFAEFKTDKPTYAFMAFSAIFTFVLGLILGLAPYRTVGSDGKPALYFHTDALHLVYAVILGALFVTVTEAAYMVAKNKFHMREEGNPTQYGTMLAMMILAVVSIIGTGISGGIIGASVLGFLTEFQDIPPGAQRWVVVVTPILLACHLTFLTAYKLSSEEEKQKRLTEQLEREQKREHELNRKLVELEVADMMATAEDMAWMSAVERGALSAGEVMGYRKAGKTLMQVESEKGVDLNDDGKVGPIATVPPAQRTNGQKEPVYVPRNFTAPVPNKRKK